MRLSVLLCNYNHGKFISEAIESFLRQTRPADEIIVVDDGSTDNSLEVLQPLSQKGLIRLIEFPTNAGLMVAFARGMQEVSSEYMLALAADDKSLPNFFEGVLRLLEKHPQAPFGVGCINEWFPDRDLLELPAHQRTTLRLMPEATYVTSQALFRGERANLPMGVMGYGAIFRTDLMRQIVPDLSHTGHLMDWFLMRVMAFREGYCFLPEVVVHRRNLAGSLSDAATRHWEIRKKACQEVLRLLDTPAYRDVKPQFRDSGALAVGGYRVLAMLLAQPGRWEYLTRPLILKCLLNCVPDRFKTTLRNLQGRWLALSPNLRERTR